MLDRVQPRLVGVAWIFLASCVLDRSGLGRWEDTVEDGGPRSPAADASTDAGLSGGGQGAPQMAADGGVDSGAQPADAGAERDGSESEEPVDASEGDGAAVDGGVEDPLALASSAFAAGDALPARFTCYDAGVSPPLAWGEPPAATASFALVLRQDDALSGTTRVLWALWDIPPSTRAIPEDLGMSPMPPGLPGAKQVSGAAARFGFYFQPPCPLDTSEIEFTLYALAQTHIEGASTLMLPAQVAELVSTRGDVIAEVGLRATVQRP